MFILQELLGFLIGFAISTLLMLNIASNYSFRNISFKSKEIDQSSLNASMTWNIIRISNETYESDLAKQLFNNIRVLCWVFTHPTNHKLKVPHVKNTWGKRCNKLLFMSIEKDPNNPDVVAIPIPEGRSHLWNKTRLVMKYVYENHYNDADWFMRADDDNFILMENLRYTLAQYHPETSLYIGHRFAVDYPEVREGYMAGGGHIFSKKALKKFVTSIMPNETLCDNNDGEADDLLVGQCLKKYAIFLDARDLLNQKQIFPVGVEEHLQHRKADFSYWYWVNLWRNVTQGGLDCCSEFYIGTHYVSPKEMYLLEYLVYEVHPFGIKKNVSEVLPRKLSLDEIIKASDAESFSPNFREHENIHYIDDDEKYS